MKSPEEVIANAIRYDHAPGSGARAIIDALRDEGYVIVATATGRLPETTRMYDLSTTVAGHPVVRRVIRRQPVSNDPPTVAEC